MLTALALVANLGREVAKDLQDMEGDRGVRKTLPLTAGKEKARVVGVACFGLAVALSPLPVFPVDFFAPLPFYLPLVLAADATFIYAAASLAASPGRASTAAKVAMLIGMMAFALGALS